VALTLGVVAGLGSLIIPGLVVVYTAIGLLLLAIVGARHGIRELAIAATGMTTIVGALALCIAMLRKGSYEASAFAAVFAALAVGISIAIAGFGGAWSARSSQKRAVWLSTGSAGLAVFALAVAATSFAVGAGIQTNGPQDPSEAFVSVVSAIFIASLLVSLAAVGCALVGLVMAVTEKPRSPSHGLHSA
jgi:hypothetical protein